MPRGVYKRKNKVEDVKPAFISRKPPKRLSKAEARKLKEAASQVQPETPEAYVKPYKEEFQQPSNPYRHVITIFQDRAGNRTINLIGSSQRLEEILANLRAHNKDVFRLTAIEVNITATATFSNDSEPF